MTDYTDHGATPVDDAAVEHPPTVDEVRQRQELNYPAQAATAQVGGPQEAVAAADALATDEVDGKADADEKGDADEVGDRQRVSEMPETQLSVAVIIGSTRPGRIGATVAAWFVATAARQRDDMRFDVVDLLDAHLPDRLPGSGEQTSDEVDRYRACISAADAVIVVTPEYNHGYPAALKQAIDLLAVEWQAKPIAFVAYGGMAGGMRAVEQLRQVFAELQATTIRDVVGFHGVHAQFVDGRLSNPTPATEAAAVLLDRLAWWARALRRARDTDPYPG